MLTTNLLSWRGKARILLEPFTKPSGGDETVGSFLSRKFGREAYKYYFGPLYGGIYASDPQDMYMRHTLSRALDNAGISGSVLISVLKKVIRGVETPPACSFEDGMQTLPRTLYDEHKDEVKLRTPVTRIRDTNSGFVLETTRGEEEVDTVVITTPADVTAGLLEEIDPESSRKLESINYNPLVYVHLYSECDLEGFGYQVQWDEDYNTLGVTWNASMFDRKGVYTCFLGGAKNPGLVDKAEDYLGD
ncbi:MAG: FAD-dependent oxidoreductase, partial [Halobacteria archaeon]|nr:FAD-dependent oxidoreductase [Halobacteria archaeon]